MALYLGIDGGGTGCRSVVAEEEGRVLGRGAAGPANIASDPEGARANILAAALAALAAAGLSDGELSGLRAGLGLAGANAGGTVERLRGALPFAARIETDAVAAAKGALGGEDGVVAALGTGSVFAVQRAGRVRQVGGWGLMLGDEGSGAWIGRAFCALSLGAEEGRSPMSPLLRALLDEHGGPQGIISFSLSARPADFAALAPRLLGCDDPAAAEILDRAETDVAEVIAFLQADDSLPVVVLGGLGPHFAERIGRRGPWRVQAPKGTALDGALRLAYEVGGP